MMKIVCVAFLFVATATASRHLSPGSRSLLHTVPPDKFDRLVHPTAAQHTQTYRDIPKRGNTGTTKGVHHDEYGASRTAYALKWQDGKVTQRQSVKFPSTEP